MKMLHERLRAIRWDGELARSKDYAGGSCCHYRWCPESPSKCATREGCRTAAPLIAPPNHKE